MNTNLEQLTEDKHSWMNMPHILFCILFMFSTSIYAASYEEGKQAYISKDYESALKILKPLAEEGNSQAQITLGLCFLPHHLGISCCYARKDLPTARG